MSARKRLIVNADDLGRTPGVNRGVFEAHRSGIVTSATMLVNYEAASEAATQLKDHPALGVGLHLALTGGRPTLPPASVPRLVDASGQLPSRVEDLARATHRDVLAELRAQLKRFRALVKAEPTHFDCHHHVHQLPVVREAVVTLAWEVGLPVRSISNEMRERFRREGIPTADAFIEAFHADGATVEVLVQLLSDLPLGLSELMCHPAVVDEELRTGSRYAEPRGRELQALTHADPRQVLQAMGIKLVHYGALHEVAAVDPMDRQA